MNHLRASLRLGWLILILLGGWGIPGLSIARDDRPNILLIVADDLGWMDVGWHGGPFLTPHLDHLVREGIELDRHYVQPVCTPTRTALMSGRYPGRFGPHALVPQNLRAMPLGTVTLASALRTLGYHTSLSGKWHLGSLPAWGPNHFGFDRSYGTLTGAADPWTHKYRRGEYEDTWHRDGRFLHETGNATELVAADAVQRIQEKKTPWFVYVPFHAVHTPVDAPEQYKALYRGVRFDSDEVKHDSRLRLAAMVSQLDAKVGELMSAVKATGQQDNTLVIFTSDNGGIESVRNAYVGEIADSPFNSENDPLRGQKGTLYEGGIRVAAFTWWPGHWPPRKFTQPVHAVDWFPTLAAIAGYRHPPGLDWDGIDLSSALAGLTSVPTSRPIYIALPNGRALISADWKILSMNNKPPELYHLARDPFEKENLAEREPARLEELRRMLKAQASLDNPTVPADLAGRKR
jgi:arylsulfatase A-like enzyme